MTFYKTLDASLLHIKPSTEEWLRRHADDPSSPLEISRFDTLFTSEYLLWVYSALGENDAIDENAGIPEDLAKILNIANENDCRWVFMSQDGETIEGLPRYGEGGDPL